MRRTRRARGLGAAAAVAAVLGVVAAGPPIGGPAGGPAGGGHSGTPVSYVPPWVVALHAEDYVTGQRRACTGIVLSPVRTLATPDCFLGRGADDFTSSDPNSSSSYPYYRSHPQYDAVTRAADVSVFDDQTPASDGRAVLAGPGDSALYASGTRATFDSWTGTGPDAVRVKHTEQVVVRSAASCASLLGTVLPSGTFCTVPASGTPAVDPAADQCWGDAGGGLLSGGKLIGISATKSTACVQDGVRLYTKISSYVSLIQDWSHDVDANFLDSGSVIGTEPTISSTLTLADICTTDVTGASLAGCAVDNGGQVVVSGYNLTLEEGDADGDGRGDLLIRTTGGTLYRTTAETGDSGGFYRRTELATGWNAYNRIVAPRDISGDGYPDVLARDSSGVLWLYRGDGKGGFAARQRIGGGWNQYTAITGRGDLSGDGRPDLVARDSSGVLWLYRGDGKGGFAARQRIGGGWNQYKFLVASGDIDHNGRQDFLGVTTSGAVYLYNADNNGGFAARKSLHAANLSRYKSLT